MPPHLSDLNVYLGKLDEVHFIHSVNCGKLLSDQNCTLQSSSAKNHKNKSLCLIINNIKNNNRIFWAQLSISLLSVTEKTDKQKEDCTLKA